MFQAVDYWVLSTRVLNRNSEGLLQEEALALGILGRKITELLPADELRSGPRQVAAEAAKIPIYDVGENPIVPTFVNSHTHLALAPLRGITSASTRAGNVVTDVFFEIEKRMSATDVRAFTKLGAYESLLCGVGEVWDHYYFGEEVAGALLEVGLPGVVAPTLQDLEGPGRVDFEEQLLATENIAQGAKFKEGGVRAALGPHASDTVSRGLFERVGELARSWKLPIHLHLAQSIEEVRQGASRFEEGAAFELAETFAGAEVLMAHGLYLSEAECARLVQAGWVLGYCPYSQMQFGFLSPFSTWLGCGGRWVIGTDCVASNDALDPQRELPLIGGDAAIQTSSSAEREVFLKQGDLKEAEGLESHRRAQLKRTPVSSPNSLLEAAWAISLSGWTKGGASGIQVGASASFLILDAAHPALFPNTDLKRTLAYGATAGAIDWMVVGGRIFGRDGGLHASILSSAEYRESLREARARYSELMDRSL